MITIADVLSPQDIHLGPLLVVAPALTASFGGPRLTAVVSGVAVLALVTISVVRNSVFNANHETQIAGLVIISVFIVVFSWLRERQMAELRQVRSVAEAAQQVVLQPLPERMGPLRVAVAYQAAADHARIGGDLYAAVRTRNGTRLLIGDVRGKGLMAVDDAGLLLSAFRSAAHRELTLAALQDDLEATVCWSLEQPARVGADADESFITTVLVDIPDGEPVVHVVNSGHPPPLRLHAGRVTLLSPHHYSPPMGLCLPHEGEMGPDTFRFEPGDMLLLHTDGATEARDAAGGFYPFTARVAAFADGAAPDRLVARLREDLLAHTGGALGDDAALVAVEREPAAGPGAAPGRTRSVQQGATGCGS
ncbi:serine/threonine-protein phosphatase [Streptomyces sp. NBC_01476]|uniref:PP2C family protein-serine/threonine phosphatase n=1 Tax=Streptomyces sp. NBC_01476 TaxID=2903881 RepID=UPI002E2FF5B2|nr:PP2C family protein-serine/threonine phosphatase [Streptomyces sp. NBC_01476]